MKKLFYFIKKNNTNKNQNYRSKIVRQRTTYLITYSLVAIVISIIAIYICVVSNKKVENMIETQNSKWDTIQIP